MPIISHAARIVRKTRAKTRPSITVFNQDVGITVPNWVEDINSFPRWIDSEDVPEKHKIWWLQGEVWIDMSREQLFSHNRLRTAIDSKLVAIAEGEELGVYLSSGAHFTNLPADISGNPDALFVSHDAFRTERVTHVKDKQGGCNELVGAPDMLMEVMSDSSVKKDAELLREAYAAAGIPEYWLIDARKEPLRFDIYRLTTRGYVASRKQDGWIKSPVFGRSFRLTESRDPSGNPKYRLEVR